MTSIVRMFLRPVVWGARVLFKFDRLEKIPLVKLDMPIAEVFALYDYGDPVYSEPDEYLPAATFYRLTAGPFHTAMIVEWNGRVCCVSYWPQYPDPRRDLMCMLEEYGEGIGWDEIETGYLHVRKDHKVLLRCSAFPAISVETAEYLEAKSEASRTS